MEKARKNLKLTSIVILIFAGLSLLNVFTELHFGDLNNATIPEGAPSNIISITKIILVSISLLLVLPQVYIGIKGIKIAKCPKPSKAHIVWAIILLVLSIIALISPIADIIKNVSVYENVRYICSTLVEVIMFYEYIRYSKEIANEI